MAGGLMALGPPAGQHPAQNQFSFGDTPTRDHQRDRLTDRLRRRISVQPLSAVIQGVDDAWEVCLLKFTIDMIERSAGGNLGDFRKRGLI